MEFWESLHLPQPNDSFVAVNRLLRMARDGLQARVLTVVAPYGSGKSELFSTVMLEAVRLHNARVAWIRLEGKPEDAPTLEQVIATLDSLRDDEEESTDAGDARTPSPVQAVRMNYIVLDCHCMSMDDNATDAIRRLVGLADAHLHLVVLCRRNPLANMTALRLAGDVAEIGSEDLLLTSQERLFFLQNRCPGLSSRDAFELADLSRGWVIILAMASSSANSFARTQRFSSAGFSKAVLTQNGAVPKMKKGLGR